ncbi:MAG: biotin--[acetyl-CoA-carboxylase] ligase [Pseudomonadota bacterium]|nr:biotin--[acetyl-CoA-carboxylase] ligase [Pseudomonadota bacterium]
MDATLTSKPLAGGLALVALAADYIAQALAPAWPGACTVEAVTSTVSTSKDLSVRARAQQPTACLLRATDFQTGGRGRHQRAWHAAPGDALLFSIAIPIAVVPATLPAVTLACAVALAESLAANGVVVQIKWPNDIRVSGYKLAGILTELVSDRSARYTLIVGVGMNFRLDEKTRCAIGQPAMALDQILGTEGEQERERWIGRLGGAIIGAAMQFCRDGFEPFRDRFNRLLEARGEIVDVLDIDRNDHPGLSGRVIEVDSFGRLVIESGGKRHCISAGDVSIRAASR